MAKNTKIEWATHTYNPWIGCAKVSPACDHCYAEDLMDVRYKRVNWGTGEARARTSPQTRNAPFKWDRAAAKAGKKATVFCLSLGDIWDNEVDPLWRREAFDVMRATPHLIYLLLSKRIGNAIRMAGEAGGLPANAALGATVVNQEEVNRDVPKLIRAAYWTPALFTFLSIEPLLGPIDLTAIPRSPSTGGGYMRPLDGRFEKIGWVIVGGESGHHARPMHPDWARSLRDQCAAAGVPFFFKQHGEWFPRDQWEHNPTLILPDDCEAYENSDKTHVFGDGLNGFIPVHRVGKHAAGRLLDGREHNGFPKEIAG